MVVIVMIIVLRIIVFIIIISAILIMVVIITSENNRWCISMAVAPALHFALDLRFQLKTIETNGPLKNMKSNVIWCSERKIITIPSLRKNYHRQSLMF